MKAPCPHLLLLGVVCVVLFATASHAPVEPGCTGDKCNVIPGGALPLARHHRKLLNQRIEGGSGFNAPVAESMGGPFAGGMTATIGSGGGSNAWNYLPERLGSWTNFAEFMHDRSDKFEHDRSDEIGNNQHNKGMRG